MVLQSVPIEMLLPILNIQAKQLGGSAIAHQDRFDSTFGQAAPKLDSLQNHCAISVQQHPLGMKVHNRLTPVLHTSVVQVGAALENNLGYPIGESGCPYGWRGEIFGKDGLAT